MIVQHRKVLRGFRALFRLNPVFSVSYIPVVWLFSLRIHLCYFTGRLLTFGSIISQVCLRFRACVFT